MLCDFLFMAGSTLFGRNHRIDKYRLALVLLVRIGTGRSFLGLVAVVAIDLLLGVRTLLIRPSLFEIHAAYFTCASWKNFFTRSGDFSKACMWAVVAAFSLALVRTGTYV